MYDIRNKTLAFRIDMEKSDKMTKVQNNCIKLFYLKLFYKDLQLHY